MAKKSGTLLFRLILVGLLTIGGGCYKSQSTRHDAGPGSTDRDGQAESDGSLDGSGDADSDADADADGSVDECRSFNVTTPAEGVPATAQAICAQASGQNVESNGAAFVTMEGTSDSSSTFSGLVTIPNALQGRIVNLPVLAVIEAQPQTLLNTTFSNVQASGNGFSFTAQLPSEPNLSNEMTIRVTLEVSCGSGPQSTTRFVESITYLQWCGSTKQNAQEDVFAWISSGGTCWDCTPVCEMAPSPIVSSDPNDDLALPRALQAEIVPLWMDGRDLCLSVEAQGTLGRTTYAWSVSGGLLSCADSGQVLWRLPREPGPYLAQVAVQDADSAVVAGFRFRHSA